MFDFLILSTSGSIFIAIIFLIYFYIHVFIHEMGHYISSKILGYQVVSFRIGEGPTLFKSNVFEFKLFPISGEVSVYQKMKVNPYKWFIVSISGSLLCCLIALGVNIFWINYHFTNILIDYMVFLFTMCLYSDIVNLVPVGKSSKEFSDGMQALICAAYILKGREK